MVIKGYELMTLQNVFKKPFWSSLVKTTDTLDFSYKDGIGEFLAGAAGPRHKYYNEGFIYFSFLLSKEKVVGSRKDGMTTLVKSRRDVE